MLEFLLFLHAQEKEILELIQKANYTVEENTPLCLINEKFFGFLKKRPKVVIICTENAKEYGGYNFMKNTNSNSETSFKTGLMIRRALRHESVHIAQECNNGNLIQPNKSKQIRINSTKLNALKASVDLVGNEEKEYEAYAMEDQPRRIIKALKEFCIKPIEDSAQDIYTFE